jgi:formylglycine-generating enzyme
MERVMKRIISGLLSLCVASVVLLNVEGCSGKGSSGGGTIGVISFDDVTNIGDTVSVSVGSSVFNMTYVNNSTSSITFPMGLTDSTTGTITTQFFLSETDITYETWDIIRTWAVSHGYTIANAGQNGTDGSNSDLGFNTSISTKYPVTCVNWRSAIVWCNALTEYYNANNGSEPDLDCVYYTDSNYATPLRVSTTSTTVTNTTAGSQDYPYIKAATNSNTSMANCTAKGFRLPTSAEYEFAARYRGNDSTNSVAAYTNPYYTKGDSASGATLNYSNSTETARVAVYGVTSTAVVKTKDSNTLGLYDITGNVLKWCFDDSSSNRPKRGCYYGAISNLARLGYIVNDPIYFATTDSGLRISKIK